MNEQADQNAIEEGRLSAKNIVYAIQGKKNKKKAFNYKNKAIMAQIGKRTGVAQLFGHKFHGLIAWWLWRTFYLSNLPTINNKLKVMGDWNADILFKPDVSMIKRFVVKEGYHQDVLESRKIKKEMERLIALQARANRLIRVTLNPVFWQVFATSCDSSTVWPPI